MSVPDYYLTPTGDLYDLMRWKWGEELLLAHLQMQIFEYAYRVDKGQVASDLTKIGVLAARALAVVSECAAMDAEADALLQQLPDTYGPLLAEVSDTELAAACAVRGWGIVRPPQGPEAPERPTDEEETALPDGRTDLSPFPCIDDEALEQAYWTIATARPGEQQHATFFEQCTRLIRRHLTYFQARLCEAETYVRAYATQCEAPQGRPGARALLAQLMCTPVAEPHETSTSAARSLQEMATALRASGWVVASPESPFPEPLWREIGAREHYHTIPIPAQYRSMDEGAEVRHGVPDASTIAFRVERSPEHLAEVLRAYGWSVSSAAPFDFWRHLVAQADWSAQTFGPGRRTQGLVAHIRNEIEEILAQPDDVEEWIDVLILACDGAWRTGATATAIIDTLIAKTAVNHARTWPDWRTLPQDQPSEHVRAPVAPVLPAADDGVLPLTVFQHCVTCELDRAHPWSASAVRGRLGELGIPASGLWSDWDIEVRRREPRFAGMTQEVPRA
jgi:hypothetical protein